MNKVSYHLCQFLFMCLNKLQFIKPCFSAIPDDLRILQLQNIVRQSGRRGTPPHIQKDMTQSRPTVEEISNNQSNRLSHLNQSDTHLDHSSGSRHLDMEKCQSEIVKLPPRVNFSTKLQRQNSNSSLRGKSGLGIQMGCSSFSNRCQSPPMVSFKAPGRQPPSYDSYNHRASKYDRQNSNCSNRSQNRFMNDTLDSLATTAYDDDDNTTTSGSYTIDNNAPDDFVELNVQQLKDIFV